MRDRDHSIHISWFITSRLVPERVYLFRRSDPEEDATHAGAERKGTRMWFDRYALYD